MRVPLSWLREYVDIEIPVEELARRLTAAGIEVAAIERIPHAPLSWAKVYVGQILEVKPHPNADRLRIAVIDYGKGRPVSSVVGAPNIQTGDKGQKVPLAEVGAVLIDGHSDGKLFTVQEAQIRGVTSEAVICSEKELGLSDDHTGVLVLDDDAPVGAPLSDVLGDVVLELDLTPNLARCLSIIGVAREVAALTGKRIKLKEPEWEATGEPIEHQVEIKIADKDLCARYSASLIKNVKIAPSPFWLRRRLTLAGQRPINNIVDITNYVMLEWGQPLHAFDFEKLQTLNGKKRILVRRAKPGERLTTLDGVERTLTGEMLLITDAKSARSTRPIALAGVMGGLETEVSEGTKNILLESANFNGFNNRRTAQALKLFSEASLRFSRGIPPELTVLALKRASELMRQLAGGTIAQGIADVYAVKHKPKIIQITPAEVERILGIELSAERIVGILESLDFHCEATKRSIKVKVPYHRLDVEIGADLIEEIARMVGYDQIPNTLIYDTLPLQRRNLSLELEMRVKEILVGCGLTEVITYSLTDLESITKLDPDKKLVETSSYIKVANPLSREREYMRQTLMNSLLETVGSNLRHTDRVTIFEIGRIYLPRAAGPAVAPQAQLPDEPRRLGIALAGPRELASWQVGKLGGRAAAPLDFFDLKGILEALLAHLQITHYVLVPTQHVTFHAGRAANLILNGEPIGILGEIHPKVREHFDLAAERVCLAEIDLEKLLAQVKPARYYEAIPRFPAADRDIAVIIDGDLPAYKIQELIEKTGGAWLKRVTLFDVYRGEQIPSGKKSLAYSLTYQADDRTLTDEEVNRVHEQIQRALEREFKAQVRGPE